MNKEELQLRLDIINEEIDKLILATTSCEIYFPEVHELMAEREAILLQLQEN